MGRIIPNIWKVIKIHGSKPQKSFILSLIPTIFSGLLIKPPCKCHHPTNVGSKSLDHTHTSNGWLRNPNQVIGGKHPMIYRFSTIPGAKYIKSGSSWSLTNTSSLRLHPEQYLGHSKVTLPPDRATARASRTNLLNILRDRLRSSSSLLKNFCRTWMFMKLPQCPMTQFALHGSKPHHRACLLRAIWRPRRFLWSRTWWTLGRGCWFLRWTPCWSRSRSSWAAKPCSSVNVNISLTWIRALWKRFPES